MNPQTPPHAAELSLHQTLKRVEDYVRREPTQAAALALGAGVVLNLLPPRLLVGVATSIATRLLPPVLLGLGMLKAFEMCCEKEVGRTP
jgi:hypothetical protein